MRKSIILSILIGAIVFSVTAINMFHENSESKATQVFLSGSTANVYNSAQELYNGADIVAIGTFDSVSNTGVLSKTVIPFTDFSFIPEKVLKGSIDGNNILVHQIGGVTEQGIVDLDEDPLYSVGEKALLFLKKGADGKCFTVGAYQGRFPIKDNLISSVNYVLPERVKFATVDVAPMPVDEFCKALDKINGQQQ